MRIEDLSWEDLHDVSKILKLSGRSGMNKTELYNILVLGENGRFNLDKQDLEKLYELYDLQNNKNVKNLARIMLKKKYQEFISQISKKREEISLKKKGKISIRDPEQIDIYELRELAEKLELENVDKMNYRNLYNILIGPNLLEKSYEEIDEMMEKYDKNLKSHYKKIIFLSGQIEKDILEKFKISEENLIKLAKEYGLNYVESKNRDEIILDIITRALQIKVHQNKYFRLKSKK